MNILHTLLLFLPLFHNMPFQAFIDRSGHFGSLHDKGRHFSSIETAIHLNQEKKIIFSTSYQLILTLDTGCEDYQSDVFGKG